MGKSIPGVVKEKQGGQYSWSEVRKLNSGRGVRVVQINRKGGDQIMCGLSAILGTWPSLQIIREAVEEFEWNSIIGHK